MNDYIETKTLYTKNIKPIENDKKTINNKIITNEIKLENIIQEQYNKTINYDTTIINTYDEDNPKDLISETSTTEEIINYQKNRELLPNTNMTIYKNLSVDIFGNIYVLLTNNNTTQSELLIYNNDLVYIKKIIFTNDFIPIIVCCYKSYIYLSSSNKIKRYNLNYTNDKESSTELITGAIIELYTDLINLYITINNTNYYIIDENLENITLSNKGVPIEYNYTFTISLGLSKVLPNDYTFYCQSSTSPEGITQAINTMIEDKYERIFIGGYCNSTPTTNDIIFKVMDKNYNTIMIKKYGNTDFINKNILYIFIDHLSNYWIGGESKDSSGIICVVLNEKLEIIQTYNNESSDFIYYNITYIFEDHNNYIWLGGDYKDSSDSSTNTKINCSIINNNNNTRPIIKNFSGNSSENIIYGNIRCINEIYYNNNYYIFCCMNPISSDNSHKIFYILEYITPDNLTLKQSLTHGTYMQVVNYIYLDKLNNIWIGGYHWDSYSSYYTCLKCKLDIITNGINDNTIIKRWSRTNTSFINFEIYKIYEDKYGNIIICGYASSTDGKKLVILDKTDNDNILYSIPHISDTYIKTVYNSPTNKLYIGGMIDNNNNINGQIYNTVPYSLIKYWNRGNSNFVYSIVYTIYEDHLGRIWIGGNSAPGYKNCIVLDNNFNLIKSWDYQDSNFIYYNINIIYEDHLGRIWIGGYGNTGNKICVVLDSNFNIIKSWNYYDSDFIYREIKIIYEDHLGRIWIGGLSSTGYKSCIVLDSNFNLIKYWNYKDNNSDFVYEEIKIIYEDHLGRIWIGGLSSTGYKSCIVLDSNFNLIKYWNYNDSDSNFVYRSVNSIYEDHLGRIWIGGSGYQGYKNCVVLDSNFNLIKYWNYQDSNSNFVYWLINSIYEDHLGRIWIGGSAQSPTTESGITTYYKNCVVLDSNFNLIKYWNYQDSNSNFIYWLINSIYEDHLGRIWVGGSSSSVEYKICVVLDNNFNIININDNNKLNLISFKTTIKGGNIYNNYTNTKPDNYYSLKSKLINSYPSDTFTLNNNNDSIINTNTNYINNSKKYEYTTNNIKSLINKSDVIITSESLNPTFKLSNISNTENNIENIFYNPSCNIYYNDMLIIGYHDKQPNLFVYDNDFNILLHIYDSSDFVNSITTFNNKLIVGFDNAIRIYNKKLDCICYKYIKNMQCLTSDNKFIYYVSFNKIYKCNKELNIIEEINHNIINKIIKLYIINNNLISLSFDILIKQYLLYNHYNNNSIYLDNILSINNYKNELYLLCSYVHYEYTNNLLPSNYFQDKHFYYTTGNVSQSNVGYNFYNVEDDSIITGNLMTVSGNNYVNLYYYENNRFYYIYQYGNINYNTSFVYNKIYFADVDGVYIQHSYIKNAFIYWADSTSSADGINLLQKGHFYKYKETMSFTKLIPNIGNVTYYCYIFDEITNPNITLTDEDDFIKEDFLNNFKQNSFYLCNQHKYFYYNINHLDNTIDNEMNNNYYYKYLGNATFQEYDKQQYQGITLYKTNQTLLKQLIYTNNELTILYNIIQNSLMLFKEDKLYIIFNDEQRNFYKIFFNLVNDKLITYNISVKDGFIEVYDNNNKKTYYLDL